LSRRAARLDADRLVPVRRTEARVVAGSSAEEVGRAGAVNSGRSLLVRVPVADRVVEGFPESAVVDDADAACFGVASLADALRAAVAPLSVDVAPFARGAVELPDAELPPEAPFRARCGVEGEGGSADDAAAGDFSALMEQRYVVIDAGCEPIPSRPAEVRGPSGAAPSTGPAGLRALHFPPLWASWARPSRSS
jgi:hypothetical protein